MTKKRVKVAQAAEELDITVMTLRWLMENREPFKKLGFVIRKPMTCRAQYVIYRDALDEVKKELGIHG